MSGFYLNTPSSRSSDSLASHPSTDDFDNLPYPQPLQRTAFLSPNFSPSEYLSTLHNRHQTLADLRAELRTRSQTLAKELLDLVNNEYQAFLHLGGDLRGGEEKVEEVRVGVLGFVKGVTQVKGKVEERRDVLAELVKERERIRRDIEIAKGLGEVHTQIGELEEALAVMSNGHLSDEDSDDEEEEDERLERLVHLYLGVRQLIESIGNDHPFLLQQEDRLSSIRTTLLLDMGTALKQAKKSTQSASKDNILSVISLYREMDEASSALKILKETAQ